MATRTGTRWQSDTAIAYAEGVQGAGADYAPMSADVHAIALNGDVWRSAAVAYLVEVGKRSGSKRTPEEYGRYLKQFLSAVADPAVTTPADVHTFAYRIGPSGKEPSASTVSVRLAAIRGFFDFCRRMRLIDHNPAIEVKTPKPAEPTPRGLSAEQLRRLLAATPDTPSGARDRAIILTAVLTGLRRSEILAFRVGDITIEPQIGRVTYRVRTKGGYERHRDLPAPAFAAIVDSIDQRGSSWGDLDPDDRVFEVSSIGFYANLRRYADKAGLADVTPHVLRHSAAKLRRETGASIEDVGALLGHRSLYTTARYLARLEGQRDEGWQSVAALLGVG